MFPRLNSPQPEMKDEEKAIIHTLNVDGEEVTVSKFYGTTVDLNAQSVKIRARKKLVMGSNVEVMLRLEGQHKPFFLSGVITGMETVRGTADGGFIIHITFNHKHDSDTSLWRKLFH